MTSTLRDSAPGTWEHNGPPHRQRCDDAAVSDPPPAVFRLPRISVVAVLLLAVCATPLAFAAPGLQVVYLVPALLLFWVLHTRTTVGADGVVVRRIRTRRLGWPQIEGLALRGDGRVRAVLHDGQEVMLPGVRTRHLPVLADSSGGRITDPGQHRHGM